MKNYSAPELAIVLLAASVGIVLILGALAMIIRGSVNPTPELLKVRELYFGLVGTIAGGVLTALGMSKNKT